MLNMSPQSNLGRGPCRFDNVPHLIHHCLGRLQALPQTAAPMVHTLSHSYAAKSLLVTMGVSYSPAKLPVPVDRSPNPTTCVILGPVRPTFPNGIHIRSAVLPQWTGQTHGHRPTDGWWECSMTIGRLRCIESDTA